MQVPSDSRPEEPTLEQNRRAYDQMARAGEALCRSATAEELADPLAAVDPIGWLGASVAGQRVLCLAAGGGRQSALYAKAGADVTVVDLSPEMLLRDREAAEAHGLNVRTIQANMQALPMLADASFDLVIHPVSTCYVADVAPVFREVARVLRGGGIYISQHKQPISLQASLAPGAEGHYEIRDTYYRSDPIPPPPERTTAARRLREHRSIEYLHRWEQIVGGICRAGFVIEDLVEPVHAKADEPSGAFGHRATYIAPYVRIKARRNAPTGRVGSLLLPS